MKWFLVLWVSYSCPSRFIPKSAHKYLCTAIPHHKIYTKRKRALRELGKRGCDSNANPQLFWCEGLKCYDQKVKCAPVMRLKNGSGEKVKL